MRGFWAWQTQVNQTEHENAWWLIAVMECPYANQQIKMNRCPYLWLSAVTSRQKCECESFCVKMGAVSFLRCWLTRIQFLGLQSQLEIYFWCWADQRCFWCWMGDAAEGATKCSCCLHSDKAETVLASLDRCTCVTNIQSWEWHHRDEVI